MAYIDTYVQLLMNGGPDVDLGVPDAVLQDTSTYKAYHSTGGYFFEVRGLEMQTPSGIVTDIRLSDNNWNTVISLQDLNMRVGDLPGGNFDAIFTKVMGGNDFVAASDFNDYIHRYNGNDYLAGYGGEDTLLGDAGNDTLHGGPGTDILVGGAGKDLLTGSGGTDGAIFTSIYDSGITFAQRDVFNTFAHGDKIDLHMIDANSKVAGNQAFTFVQNFTGVAGQLQWDQTAPTGYLVTGDLNGDRVADFSVQLYAAPTFGTLHAWDFIL
jgi:Ca2+-binding RTX toxin-like protein